MSAPTVPTRIQSRDEAPIDLQRLPLLQTLDRLPKGVLVHVNGQVAYANAQAEQVFGLTIDQMLGRTPFNPLLRAVREDGSPLPAEEYPVSVTIRTGEPVYGMTVGSCRPDGDLIWLEVDACPITPVGEGDISIVLTLFTNVTERREAQERAEQARRQTMEILGSIEDGFFALDRDWRFTYVNTQGETWLRKSKGELIGHRLHDAFPEVIETRFFTAYQETMNRQLVSTAVDYYSPFDAWFEARSYPSPQGITVYFRDITERKRLEDELRLRDEEHRALLSAVPDLIFRFDRAGTYLHVPLEQESFLDERSQDLIGQTLPELLPEPAASRIVQTIARTLDEQQMQTVEYRLAFPAGTFDFEARMVPIGEHEVMALVRNVTERKAIQEALATSEAAFRTLVEQVPAIIYREGHQKTPSLEYINPYVETLIGPPPEAFIADQDLWRRHIHPDDRNRVYSLDDATNETGEPYSAEYRVIGAAGRVRWVHDTAELIYDESGNPLCWQGIVQDVTERRELAAAEKRAEALAAADELKSALLVAVSHDLRTPLSTIKTSVTSLLSDDVDWTPEDRAAFLRDIDAETDRLDLIVANFLDLSRIEGGALRPRLGWHDVAELIEDAVNRTASLSSQHALDVSLPSSLPLAQFDYVQLVQVLVNLISNAVKYTPAGTRIAITARRKHRTVEIEVADSGPGIPDHELSHLFEFFHRGEEVAQIAGTGLGLPICKGLIEANGGRIWVESHEGEGTTVRFTLRREPV
jgi:PAS domain S-box-containing protein